MSRYPDDDSFEDEIPREATRPTDSTPPRPRSEPVPVRKTGEYPHLGQPSRRRAADRLEPIDPTTVSRPAIPRQSRQSRPLPPPPPLPPQGRSIDEPPMLADRSRPKPRRPRRESGWYLPWWSLIILLVFVGSAAVGAWAVVSSLGGDVVPGGNTPIVVVVTATFTIGPPAPPTALPPAATTPPPIILPTIAATPTLPPGNFVVGAIVEVVGVGQAGLNIRSGPGQDATIRYQAPENTRFTLKSGPQSASGDEWWEVAEVNDPTRGGWASRRYLQVVAGQ
jgi:hypothetical protein